jgi:hypothetical protein
MVNGCQHVRWVITPCARVLNVPGWYSPAKQMHLCGREDNDMPNKYGTYINFRNKAAGNRMAANYRKQFGIGLDGKPRRYGKQKQDKLNEQTTTVHPL